MDGGPQGLLLIAFDEMVIESDFEVLRPNLIPMDILQKDIGLHPQVISGELFGEIVEPELESLVFPAISIGSRCSKCEEELAACKLISAHRETLKKCTGGLGI